MTVTGERSASASLNGGTGGADLAFHVEQHGIDFIPLTERWARPRDVGGMWAGASIQIEYFIYGAILMSFGFNFAQAISLILVGNVSYFLLGLCSLQGPVAGTTVFAINRAGYGPNGSRLIALFNWLTQIGFEVEGLILIVGAAIVLQLKAGFAPGSASKVIFVLAAVAVQGVLPFLGHATILKTLRWLTIPFVALFGAMLGFAASHATTTGVAHGAGWQTYMVGLAFTITLSGLGWTENGNDYTRYCPPDTSRRGIVGWVFVGTAFPQIVVMALGAAVATFITGLGTGIGGFEPLAHQHFIPAWFVVVFMVFAMFQLFAVNSLDLYSSGVTLQALGVRVRRHVAVLIDCALALAFTMWAVFNLSFNHFLSDFVDLVIIWIAPWSAIFLVDWVLRRLRYAPGELQRTDRGSLYWSSGGIHWPAIGAQLFGMVCAMVALNPSFHVPSWMNPVTIHTGGADFSVFTGMAGGALAYLLLGWRGVRRQAVRQDELLAAAAA